MIMSTVCAGLGLSTVESHIKYKSHLSALNEISSIIDSSVKPFNSTRKKSLPSATPVDILDLAPHKLGGLPRLGALLNADSYLACV